MPTFVTQTRRMASLKRHTLWLLAGVVALFALGIAFSLVGSLYYGARNEHRQLARDAEQARVAMARLMGYYREILDNLTQDPELLDLMRVGSLAAQQDWAASRQRLLPDLQGLALLDSQGRVLGDAAALRVGPRCQDDLRRASDLDAMQPLVHREIAGHEHVDLVKMVRETDGRTLGGVFLSLRLPQLQRVIDDSLPAEHGLALYDADAQPIVRRGMVDGPAREVVMQMPSTGWTLVAQAPMRRITRNGGVQILVGLLTLAGVLVLLGSSLLVLRRGVLRDINATRDALGALARNDAVPLIVPNYAEFEPAVADINRIAQTLKDQRAQLEYLSMTDPLTGLPNRRALENHFARALGMAERGHPVALILLDVDHFKLVNDRLGHAVGDQVLRALAQSLEALTRRADFAARLAGDEFVVLLTNVEASGLEAWCRRLADHFRSELGTLGMELETGLSAGQTWLRDTADDTIHAALARADRALYQAKAHGRGRLVRDVDLAGKGAE